MPHIASFTRCFREATTHGAPLCSLAAFATLESGFAVYPVNPKTVDRRRCPARAKTDAIDASILARHGQTEHDRLRRLESDSPVITQLKLLTRDQGALVRQQTRLINQFIACLKEYYPPAGTAGIVQTQSTG